MPTDKPLQAEAQDPRLTEMQAAMEELNSRIARLAIGLGVSLNSKDDLVRVLRWQPRVPAFERRVVGNFSALAGMFAGCERRVAHKWNELRGLLALRYGVETRYVDAVGATAARRILVGAEQHLVFRGFNPGDDGIDLNQLG